jgi:hypothetical protein
MKDRIVSRGVEFRRPTQDERSEQASIKNLLEQLGAVVFTLGTVRATCCGICGSPNTDPSTRQTPGLADLVVYLPPPRRQPARGWTQVWIECKGRRGTLSLEQVAFRGLNLRAGVAHVVGGVDEVIEFLTAGGWVNTWAE